MIDIIIVTSSAILGIICALFVFQIIKIRRESQLKILGNVKYELSSLYFEKSVALDALNKINQHFEEKRIDEYERDRLSHKYINLLDEYDKRAFQLNPILEVQEIYEYRNQLNSILSDYIKKIDTKLTSLGLDNNESNSKDNDKDSTSPRPAPSRRRSAGASRARSAFTSAPAPSASGGLPCADAARPWRSRPRRPGPAEGAAFRARHGPARGPGSAG